MSDDRKVGYKKPPVHSRFKPGQSGNPRGAKKAAKLKLDIFQELETFLHTEITVSENGKKKRLTRVEALFHSLFAGAAKGNSRAYSLLITTLQKAGRLTPPPTQRGGVLLAPAPLSDEEWERRVGIEQRPHRGSAGKALVKD